MQRLFDIGHPSERHIPALKVLWKDIFDDSSDVIDNFFDKTAEADKAFCVLCNDEPVSVMYGVEATVFADGKAYNALYIYAVCTHKSFREQGLMSRLLAFVEEKAAQRGISYLFLVPATRELFGLYEKSGFVTAFVHNKRVVKKEQYNAIDISTKALSYSDYIKIRQRNINCPQAVLNENGFNSFYHPVGDSVRCVSLGEAGYVIFENENGRVTVFELFGDEGLLLSVAFDITRAEELTVYEPCENNGEPYGMAKSVDGSPIFKNGFFGISYGG